MTVLDPAVPPYTLQYGLFKFDESNGIALCGEPDATTMSEDGSFYQEFDLRLLNPTGVEATDDKTFTDYLAACRAALTLPRQTLTVKYANSTTRKWQWGGITASGQTAFLIIPELKEIEGNRRHYRFGFRVRAQFPGNIPGNVFRRDSTTKIGTSLRENRTCSLTATWTSSPGVSAYQRYLASGDGFYDTYLPINSHDQYGTLGTWVRADEDPTFNDEVSLITATRTYWEVFAGRRESTVTEISTIEDQRVCVIPSTWAATHGFTALQNYQDGAEGFFGNALPENVAGGVWVEVDTRFGFNDKNGVLTAARTYHETVGGLREKKVVCTRDAAGLATVVLTGSYYDDGLATARQNYLAGIGGLISDAMSREGITDFDSHSIPQITSYDTTGRRFFFRWTILELVYPQSLVGMDDTNAVLETLEVKVRKPMDRQSISGANPVNRLRMGRAQFIAMINKDSVGGKDPVTLWAGKFRAHVLHAIRTRLGGVLQINVYDEEVGAGLTANQLVGEVKFLVRGGTVISCLLKQAVTQIPGRDFATLADGEPWKAYPYRESPEKLLHREATIEYVVGGEVPVVWGAADAQVSGFSFIDTGLSAQESVDAQNAPGELEPAPNFWFIDRRANPPYLCLDVPTTQGGDTEDDGGVDGYQTVVHQEVQNWRYIETILPGTAIT